MLAEKQIESQYPLIDSDPHFRRVVQYFRPSDYWTMGGLTLLFPGLLGLMELSDPARKRGNFSAGLKLAGFLGLCGGFLYAYQRSTCAYLTFVLTESPFLWLVRK